MADLIGHQLGQYEITALLGKGGMAAVYRARQVSMKRDVAIKVIESEQAQTSGFVKRFEREVETIASLSHAHILKVFDYGQHDGTVYLVMELLTGGSLADLIAKGPLPLDHAARMLDQIASALDYAHRRGIIHRDLKPQNVMLDEDGNAFLSDFGIAKIMSGEQVATMTAAGAVMGTPAYMAPEQWKSEPVDARTDIYALGIILFEMLAGKLPFNADTAFGMMHKHVNEQPPIRNLGPEFPVGIERVLTTALAKNPEQRYSSAGEMSAGFKAALAGQPVVGPDSDNAFHEVLTLIDLPPEESATTVTQPHEAASTAVLAAKPADKPVPAPKSRSPLPLLGGLVVVILAAVAILFALKGGAVPTPTATIAAALLNTDAPTVTATLTPSLTLSATRTLTPSVTFTPSSTDLPNAQTQVALTLAGRGSATALIEASFTKTPTPNSRASAAAMLSALDTATAVQATLNIEASFTKTPTPTPTLTLTATPSATLTLTATDLPNVQTQVALTLAGRLTATALIQASFTKTPTPDFPATAAAMLSALDTATAVQATANAVASFTKTPTPSSTPGLATALVLVATQGNACTVSTTKPRIEVHKGPGENRAVLRFLTANQPVQVLDQALAEDGSIWWRVDISGVEDAWVAQAEVTLSSGCSGLPSPIRQSPTPTPTPVALASDICAVSTSQANVEVHKGPGYNRVTLRFLPVNQPVKVLDQAPADDKALWWKVELNGVEDAWVAQKDVSASSACGQFVPSTHTPTPTGTTTNVCVIFTSQAKVEVHKGPGYNRVTLRFLPANQSIPVIGQGTADDKSLWWKIQLEGETDAWVAQKDVSASEACNWTPTPTTTPTPPLTVAAVNTAVVSNVSSLTTTIPPATDSFCTVSTTRPKVEVHKGPGENRAVLRFMPVDQPVRVLDQAAADDKSLWWKIELEGLSEGWVPQNEVTPSAVCSQLATVTPTPAPVVCTVSTTKAKVEVHKGPGINRAVLRFMPIGQPVKVLDQATADDKSLWWKVEFDGLAEAWVAQADVTASDACKQMPTPSPT
jgi:serine/threonine-protein kinase